MSGDPATAVDRSALRERASAAFSVLGNETRLEVLLALWEANDHPHAAPGLSFSALRERVGTRDSGQFNYHLEKLRDEFVRKTEAGYSLTAAGMRIVQTVVGTVGLDEPNPDPIPAANPCPVCDGGTEFRYVNGHVILRCTECPGLYETAIGKPVGILTSEECTRSAFAGRSLLEVYDAVGTRAKGMFENLIQGVCPQCLGPVHHSLLVCAEHDPDGVCGACETRFAARVELTCGVCKEFAQGPVRSLMTFHPAVLSLYITHDVAFEYEPDPNTLLTHRLWPAGDLEQDVVSIEPPAVRVTLGSDDGTIAYTVTDDLEITDVTAE